ncbi:MAG: hypothetical protein RMJ54_18695, partial [Roseiflexaceae bacterium]|nr:hypothetical protein [Roseiflexaceae bacterium]
RRVWRGVSLVRRFSTPVDWARLALAVTVRLHIQLPCCSEDARALSGGNPPYRPTRRPEP